MTSPFSWLQPVRSDLNVTPIEGYLASKLSSILLLAKFNFGFLIKASCSTFYFKSFIKCSKFKITQMELPVSIVKIVEIFCVLYQRNEILISLEE
ncbi:hypothetical protein NPIL_576211 [Nephila pilipes]|uniref:Uncharacterized protein n=1 Tax=Nephila pilipes TaxID=299642 RepID=A0A8X6NGY0_NEPPI|nr:hypothetical protein NPIL_576211 [Nephila pilipes]